MIINERDQEIKLKKEPSIDNPGQTGINPDAAMVELINTIKKSSKITNELTSKIKTLNWILVLLGGTAVIIMIISLIFQIISK